MNVDLGQVYRGRRVLVTGHTGFKGAWLCLWLRQLGAEVTGYALPAATEPSLYSLTRLDGCIRSILGDVRDCSTLRQTFIDARPDMVFHLAAQARVDVSYHDPRETFDTNVVGTTGVLDATLASGGCRAALVITSDKCYENHGWPWGYRETDGLGGHDPYSASKACQEHVVASYRRSFFMRGGLGLATARAGNVIGGGDFTPGRLVPDCLRAFAENRPVRLRRPSAVRPWQHVLDPLEGYLLLGARLLEEPASWSEAFNFGPEPDGARPVREVVAACAAAWGAALEWEQEPGEQPHEAAELRVDASKARVRLGWRPRRRLAEALALTVDWHKKLLAGHDMAEVTLAQIGHQGEGGV